MKNPLLYTNIPKIGLVGAGYWGKNLIRIFNQLKALKTICDTDRKVLEEKKREYPNPQITVDFKEILEDKAIKGVVISTPAATHYNLVKESLLAGKDTFVEKPLALKVREGEELVRLAQDQKVILMVGHLLLYHPAIIEMQKLIKNGGLGEIQYIWSNRLNLGKLRREENVLWSFAPHDISVIINILGMPKGVWASGRSYLQENIPDTTLSSLQFDKGKLAHIFVSWLNPFKEQKLSIIGSKAMAVFDEQARDKLIVYPHKIKKYKNKNPEAIKAEGKIINILKNEPLLEEAKHFLVCIKERKEPKTNGKEALNTLKVLDACQRSINKNGKYETILGT